MDVPAIPIRVIGQWSLLSEQDRGHLRRRGILDSTEDSLRADIRQIVEDVRVRGDAALIQALADFDDCRVEADSLAVTTAEFYAAQNSVDAPLLGAIRDGIAHIRRFNERQVGERSWSFESEPGLTLGERLTPIESVGLFIPSGKASYPSVLMQLGTAAVVAGVPRIVVAIPPKSGGDPRIDDAVLVVAKELGIQEIYRVNGPAGVAAMAVGTESIPKVRMIAGPGSPAVVVAQLEVQRFGCKIEMLMGPSESMLLADDGADSVLVAADLLNEAEHGPDSTSLLVTDSQHLLDAVQRELSLQLARLPEPRRSYAAKALGENGGAILVKDMVEGAEVVNDFAPEHLQLVVTDDAEVLDAIRYAGEILVGPWTPISSANFLLGCPATLPTGGFAKVSSGVNAATFLRRMAIARADREALMRMSDSITTLASYEGFPAHEAAVRIRVDRIPNN